MITPEFLTKIIEGTELRVRKTEAQILNKICKRIVDSFNAGQENIIIPATIKEMHQLMSLGMTKEEIQKIVEKNLKPIKKEVRKAFLLSAQEISNYNTDIAKTIIQKEGFDIEIPEWEDVGLPTSATQLNMTATEIRKMEQIYNRTTKTVENLCLTMPKAGYDLYVNACEEAFMKVQAGVSPSTAIIDAIHQVSTDGIRVVEYDSGHTDRSEVAVARAVRSGVNKANSEIVLTRSGEMGINAVLVSQHFGARVTKKEDFTNHAHWQGKVYSLDWSNPVLKDFNVSVGEEEKGFKWLRKLKSMFSKQKKPEYPDFVEECGYGNILGIAGVNCRHTFSPFYLEMEQPTMQYDYEENEERYNQTQKQRSMERQIRATKIELIDLQDMQGAEAETRKVKLRQKLEAQEDALFDFCKEHNLKVENFRLEVGIGS